MLMKGQKEVRITWWVTPGDLVELTPSVELTASVGPTPSVEPTPSAQKPSFSQKDITDTTAETTKNILNTQKENEIINDINHSGHEEKQKGVSDILLWQQTTEIKQEYKEMVEKVPELEHENYKIDKDMSIEEKLQNWRKIIKNFPMDIYYDWSSQKQTQIKTNVLQKDLGNNACVWEYLESDDYCLPKKYIGEQKFNREAAEKLWLLNKIPKDYQEFEKIIWPHNTEKHLIRSYIIWEADLEISWTAEDVLKKYFSKNGDILFSGYLCLQFPDSPIFSLLHAKEFLLLWDGSIVEISKKGICRMNMPFRWGAFSLRLKK